MHEIEQKEINKSIGISKYSNDLFLDAIKIYPILKIGNEIFQKEKEIKFEADSFISIIEL